jgi:hypothetical protein
MYDYITNIGSKRIDVLRAHGPFGSPLSLSAIATYLVFYSLYIKKSAIFSCGAIIILILSGSRTAMIICFILFLSTISFKSISIKKVIYALLIISIPILFIFYFANELGLNGIIDRIFSINNYNIFTDESFKGRENTTIRTIALIWQQMPYTIFSPLKGNYVSDSAIVSMIAGSGLFLIINFFIILFAQTYKSPFKIKAKFLLLFSIIMLALMVGDAFVPAASFYLFTILYFTNERITYNNRLRNWRS